MDFKNVPPFISKFVSWISISRVVLVSAFALSLIVSVTLFEQRAFFVDFSDDQYSPEPKIRSLKISDAIYKSMKELVDRSDLIVFSGVVSANLAINQRELVYFYSDSILANVIYEDIVSEYGKVALMFTDNDDENKQMVQLINNKFSCSPYADTANMKLAPKVNSIAPIICRISLPPHYGSFLGYISFGLSRLPNEAEIIQLRAESIKIASRIYQENEKQ